MSGESRNARVSTLSHVAVISKYNFLNYFRARRFYVMLIIVAAIGGLFTLAVGYFRPPGFLLNPLAFYSAAWGGFGSFIVILATAFFGGDAISGEFQNKTGYYLVPNPIRRSAIYTGKWLAALAASTLILFLFAGIMVANSSYYFGASVPSEFLQSLFFAWVYLVAALSLAFLFSSLFKSSSISILMSVVLLLFVFNVVDTIAASVAGVEPWFSITYAGDIISHVLSDPYPAHVTTATFGGGPGGGERFTITMYNASVSEGLAILTAYFAVTAVVGLWLFEKREFTS